MKAEQAAENLATDILNIGWSFGLPERERLKQALIHYGALAFDAHANEALERAVTEVSLRCQNPLVSTRPCGGCLWCNVAAAIRSLKE